MWLYRVQLPGVPGGLWRIAPRGQAEELLGEPVARWPLQGDDLVGELTDAGGWADVAEALVRSLLPDLP